MASPLSTSTPRSSYTCHFIAACISGAEYRVSPHSLVLFLLHLDYAPCRRETRIEVWNLQRPMSNSNIPPPLGLALRRAGEAESNAHILASNSRSNASAFRLYHVELIIFLPCRRTARRLRASYMFPSTHCLCLYLCLEKLMRSQGTVFVSSGGKGAFVRQIERAFT